MTLIQKVHRGGGKILRKIFFAFSLASVITVQAQSQDINVRMSRAETKPTKALSIGLNVGIANGIGVDVAYQLKPHLSLKGSFNYANYTLNNYNYKLAKGTTDSVPQMITLNMAAKFSTINILAVYDLGKKGRFRLIGGLSYAPTNTFSANGELTSVLHFKDLELNSNDLGKGSIVMGFKNSIAPYIGIGIGRLHPRKKLNISFDLGAYYKGDYKFNINIIEGGLIKKDNEKNAAILDRNFNEKWNNKVWPNASLRIGYRLF